MRNVLGKTALVTALGGSVVMALLAACSSDDDATAPKGGVDGGLPDASRTVLDSGSGDSATTCPVVATSSCSAAACTQAAAGDASVCVDGGCVQLTTPDCPRLEGAYTDDNAIVFGVMNPNRGANAQTGQQENDGFALAVNEINANGGVPNANPCKPARKLAFVACDETGLALDGGTIDSGDAEPPLHVTVDHLARDLAVPMIAGGYTSGDSLNVITYSIPTYQNLFFSNHATSPVFATPAIGINASPNGQRLFWRTSQNTVIEGAAMTLEYGDIETAVKASSGKSTLKVYVIEKNDAFGTGTTTVIESSLMVNGAPVTGNANVKTGEYQASSGVGAGTTIAAVLADMESFNPDVIIANGTDEIVGTASPVAGFIAPYEAYVASNPGTQSKPTWLVGHSQITPAILTYADTLTAAQYQDLRSRWRGITIDAVSALSTALYTNLEKTYPMDTGTVGIPEAYDVVYSFAYAATSAYAKGSINSSTIVTGLNSILTGTSIDVGTANFLTASQQVAAGQSINLNGASGPLDFSATTGESPSDDGTWCLGVDPNTMKPYINQNALQTYNHTTMTLVGTFTCP